MGMVDGSAFEIWIYPYKVLHNLDFKVMVQGVEEDPRPRLGLFSFSPAFFKRNYIGEKWTISQQIYPALNDKVVFLIFEVQALTDVVLELSFTPDLSPMWPASLGGKYSYWDKQGFFVLSESKSENFAFFGGSHGQQVGDLPAHKLPGVRLRYRIPLKKGFHKIPLTAMAGHSPLEKIKQDFLNSRERWSDYLKERKQSITSFLKDHLIIKTPDSGLNHALKWAMLNVNFAFVDNIDLGEGLIAGYGLSGERERPGFAWYFGGDGLINSYAVVNYGDFKGARKEIEFLLKYQRQDGKIMHELSQGARFIDWFKDYGFPFFHGDTTLYFASFLNFYLKRTGDVEIIYENKEKIHKLFSWMLTCDNDKDGIVETKLAGVGASETGPLRQKMKTDIFLASLSVKAWEAMTDIFTHLGDSKKSALARIRFSDSKKSLQKLFWNQDKGYYDYAVKESGEPIEEITIWPAIGMRYKVFDRNSGMTAQRRIASPELSTDWGTRFLSSKSSYYKPSSYNNGAVWPFLTGFSSMALYNYNNPYHAFALLKSNTRIIMDFDFGAPTELLSGDIYRPLDQSVPNQIWSSGNTISAFVEGLLGLEADSLKKKVVFRPSIPLTWGHLEVENLKIGKGKINIRMKREDNSLKFSLTCSNLDGYSFFFSPNIPAIEKRIFVNQRQQSEVIPIKIDGSETAINMNFEIAKYLFPYVERAPAYGTFSQRPIIEDFVLDDQQFKLDLWGKDRVNIYFLTDGELKCSEGTLHKEEKVRVLTLYFKNSWEKKTIILTII
jgi:glycogen debranching enzyme